MSPSGSTRDRLLDAAMSLFAAQGYRRTTVGEIEEAAGFAARGGTLYKHFSSKQEVLDAAIDRYLALIPAGRVADLLPLGDRHAEGVLVFRYLFAELARTREVTALIEKEGAVAPTLAKRFWDEVGQPGYRLGADFLAGHLTADGEEGWDVDALAAVLLGAVINIRRTQWTFGAAPLGVEEERVIAVIARVLDVLAAAG